MTSTKPKNAYILESILTQGLFQFVLSFSPSHNVIESAKISRIGDGVMIGEEEKEMAGHPPALL